jgi:hypothetical protein
VLCRIEKSHRFIEIISPTYNNCDVDDASNLTYREGGHGDKWFWRELQSQMKEGNPENDAQYTLLKLR